MPVAHAKGFSTLTPQTACALAFFDYNSGKLLKTLNDLAQDIWHLGMCYLTCYITPLLSFL